MSDAGDNQERSNFPLGEWGGAERKVQIKKPETSSSICLPCSAIKVEARGSQRKLHTGITWSFYKS